MSTSIPNKLSQILNGRVLFILSAIMIFVLTNSVALNVPFHSDDYTYFLNGISLDWHIAHYLAWSGRFLVDYASSLLLNLLPKPVYTAINSLVLVITLTIVSLLPNIVSQEKQLSRGSSVILWMVFLLYWIENPNLGQTTFWLVGSANYLWTLMWAGAFMAQLLHMLNSEKKPTMPQYVLLFVLGIFAGLSNEATGITVVLFAVSLFFLFWKEHKASLTVGLLSSAIGYAFLLFSPGNAARLRVENTGDWQQQSIFTKLIYHAFGRMPGALGQFFFLFFLFIVMLLAFVWIGKGAKVKGIPHVYASLFLALSVASIAVFAASPMMPPRSQNTCLFYALVAFSFIASMLLDTKRRSAIVTLCVLTSVCALFFTGSYLLVSYAYTQTNTQASIRESVIEDAKKNGKDTALIPDWYFTRLAKETDKFDIFRSGAMAHYYGLNSLEWKNAYFNYAIIRDEKPIQVNEQLADGLTLNNLYVRLNAPLEQTIVFECSDSLEKYAQEGETKLYVHLHVDGKADTVDTDISLDQFLPIGDKYYYGVAIEGSRINKLDSIDYGFYNPTTQTSSADYTLDLKR